MFRTNQIVTYATRHQFGRKTNWSGPKKTSSWFGRPKCALWSKVAHFFIFTYFSLFSFTLITQIMWESKTFYRLKTLLRAHHLPHFPIKLELTWLVLWILTWWLLGVHFLNKKEKKIKIQRLTYSFACQSQFFYIGPQSFKYIHCAFEKNVF
jgi:hypothetical protein